MKLPKERTASYKDLVKIKTIESKEGFTVLAEKGCGLVGVYNQLVDMKRYSSKIYVRLGIFKRLELAQVYLSKLVPSYQLITRYGFRSIEIQKKYFEKQLNKFKKNEGNKEDLYERVHKLIAVPSVAGHPTGGAIDIEIFDKEKAKLLNFGTEIYDFDNKNIVVFSKDISDEARRNRLLLRKILTKYGFAPYNGEWWHFSYGDKEWAFYYKMNSAIYAEKSVNEVFNDNQ